MLLSFSLIWTSTKQQKNWTNKRHTVLTHRTNEESTWRLKHITPVITWQDEIQKSETFMMRTLTTWTKQNEKYRETNTHTQYNETNNDNDDVWNNWNAQNFLLSIQLFCTKKKKKNKNNTSDFPFGKLLLDLIFIYTNTFIWTKKKGKIFFGGEMVMTHCLNSRFFPHFFFSS